MVQHQHVGLRRACTAPPLERPDPPLGTLERRLRQAVRRLARSRSDGCRPGALAQGADAGGALLLHLRTDAIEPMDAGLGEGRGAQHQLRPCPGVDDIADLAAEQGARPATQRLAESRARPGAAQPCPRGCAHQHEIRHEAPVEKTGLAAVRFEQPDVARQRLGLQRRTRAIRRGCRKAGRRTRKAERQQSDQRVAHGADRPWHRSGTLAA